MLRPRRSKPRKPVVLSREEHELRFRAALEHRISPRTGKPTRFSARGCETSYVALTAAVMRARAAKADAFNTTKPQRSSAMARQGRPRCERTVKRHHDGLAAMGLLTVAHVRRGRATPGFRDCLRLRLTMSFVTPSKLGGGGEEPPYGGLLLPDVNSTQIAPAAPARPDPPPAAAWYDSDEEEVAMAQAPERDQVVPDWRTERDKAALEWEEQALRRLAASAEERRARIQVADERRTYRRMGRWTDDG